MADLILPDRKLEMPSSYYPGRQPTGNTKINWDNRFTKNLIGYWSFAQKDGLIDKVHSVPATFINSAYVTQNPSSVSTDRNGLGYIKITDAVGRYQGSTAGGQTVSFFIKPTPIEVWDTFLCYGYGMINKKGWRVGYGGLLTQIIFTGYSTYKAVNIGNYNRWLWITLTMNDAVPEIKLYIDGNFIDILPITVDTVTDYPNITIGTNIAESINYATLDIKDLIIHKRVLQANEIKELHANPYQFLTKV